jgi:hypothetical protein
VGREMIEDRVQQSIFKLVSSPYRNAHILLPKNIGNYHFSIPTIKPTSLTLGDAGILLSTEEFSDASARECDS